MPQVNRIHVALLLAGLFAIASVLGRGHGVPAAHAQIASDTFVGKVDGLDAFIGIGSDGYNVTAYVCDGANNNLGDNFQGTIDQASNGVLTLQAQNGDLLTLNFDQTTIDSVFVPDSSVTGTLTLASGSNYSFSTEAAVAPGGLFLANGQTMADGSAGDGGWVVLNDGEVRGAFSLGQANFGHSGVLGGTLLFAPALAPQLVVPQLPNFGQNLNQVFLGGGGTLTLPVVVTQPIVFKLVIFRFNGMG
jgi:hypothetical protein